MAHCPGSRPWSLAPHHPAGEPVAGDVFLYRRLWRNSSCRWRGSWPGHFGQAPQAGKGQGDGNEYGVPGIPAGPPPGPRPGHLMNPPVAVRPLSWCRPAARGGAGACVLPAPPPILRRLGLFPPSLGHPPPPSASLRRPGGRPFPQPPGSDTIPIACRPPVCVRHAQAGRFSSIRFTRRAHARDRVAALRGARRIKAYSLGCSGCVR